MEEQSNGLVHIIWTLNQGGAERFCIELASCSTKDRIIVVRHGDRALTSLSSVIFLQGNIFRKILMLLKITKGKTVLIWMYKSYILFAPLSVKRKVVLCIHHDLQFWNQEKISTKISIILSAIFHRFFYRNPCIFVSEASRNSHLKLGFHIRRSEVIYNGVKDFSLIGKNTTTRTMIYVGRKDPIKNIDLAFRISCMLVRTSKIDKVTFVGSGLDKSLCDELSEHYDVDFSILNKIVFLGFQTNIDSLYLESDLLILTSYSESCPMSIIEALRGGLAIASTDVGDVRKMISEENIIFETEEDAVNMISDLFDDPIKLQEIKTKNRNIYESSFELKSVRKKYEACAESLFSSK